MDKHHTAGYELVETMAANNYQWPNDRQAPRRPAGVYEVDSITALAAQVAALTKRLDNQETSAVQNVQSVVVQCELC